MSKRSFFLRLSLFLAPFVVVFALPLRLLLASWELAPVSMIAAQHAAASPTSVYGPAYSNPDKGYKFAAMALRQVPVVAIGTSRVMQVRSDFFRDGEDTFYNAGGVVTRMFDHRVLVDKWPSPQTRRIIVGLDHWSFNEKWADFGEDPGIAREYEGDYSALDVIQRSLQVYTDLSMHKFSIADITRENDSFGINGMSHGNGFLRDGSYVYADMRQPESVRDYGIQNTLDRIHAASDRFVPGAEPSKRALAELDRVAHAWRAKGFEVVAFMPPFAPKAVQALRASGRHEYVFRVGSAVREVLDRHGIPFADFTSCAPIACRDDEFVDGFHGGSVVYARLLLELATQSPWLASLVDRPSLVARLERQPPSWELSRELEARN